MPSTSSVSLKPEFANFWGQHSGGKHVPLHFVEHPTDPMKTIIRFVEPDYIKYYDEDLILCGDPSNVAKLSQKRQGWVFKQNQLHEARQTIKDYNSMKVPMSNTISHRIETITFDSSSDMPTHFGNVRFSNGEKVYILDIQSPIYNITDDSPYQRWDFDNDEVETADDGSGPIYWVNPVDSVSRFANKIGVWSNWHCAFIIREEEFDKYMRFCGFTVSQ